MTEGLLEPTLQTGYDSREPRFASNTRARPRKTHTQESTTDIMLTNVADPVIEQPAARFPDLPDQLEKDLVQIFKLLSDETRLRILVYLVREKELHVTALCDRLGQSQPAVSHHLALLRVAGLIEARRDGKHNFYSVRAMHFHRVIGELFEKLSDPVTDTVRFDDFVLSQDAR